MEEALSWMKEEENVGNYLGRRDVVVVKLNLSVFSALVVETLSVPSKSTSQLEFTCTLLSRYHVDFSDVK